MDLASLSRGADWASRGGASRHRATPIAALIPSAARDLGHAYPEPISGRTGVGKVPRCARDEECAREDRDLELIPHPQRELLILSYPGPVPPQLVIALEDHVVDRLVGEPEGGDPAGQRVVAHHAGGHAGLRVEALVPD